DGPGVFVFHDVGHVLEDHVTLRAIKERSLEATPAQTFVLTGATISVPDELRGLALLWTLEPPSDAEVQRRVADTVEELRSRHLAQIELTEERVRELADRLKGLSLPEAQRLILRAALDDCRLD